MEPIVKRSLVPPSKRAPGHAGDEAWMHETRQPEAPDDERGGGQTHNQVYCQYNYNTLGRGGKGRKGSRKASATTYRWAPDVAAILAELPQEASRTAWIEDAIRRKAGPPSEAEALRRELAALEAQAEEVAARREAVQAKLAEFASGSLEEQRALVRAYLGNGGKDAGVGKQRRWCRDRGVEWEVFAGVSRG